MVTRGLSHFMFVCVTIFILWIKPTSTTLTVTAYDGTGIVKQQPLTLGCNYTKGGSDQILDFSWRRESVVILSGSVTAQTSNFLPNTAWTTSGVFLGDYTSSLTIQLPASSVTPSVAGQYTCSVDTLTGRVQDTATATVQSTSTRVTVTTYDGTGIVKQQSLTLGCNYTKGGSYQILDFNWRRGSVIILSGSVTAQTSNFLENTTWTTSGVFLGDYTSSLTIQLPTSSVTPSVAGQYTCSVNTLTGRVLDTATATGLYAPKIKSSIFPSSRTVTEFSRLQIDCSRYTTPGNPPRTSYTWTYGGSTIGSGAVLDINRGGQYTCTASNTVGSDSETVSVDVQSLPKTPNEVTVENVTSTSVTITWRSNNNGGATQTFSTEFRTMKGEWRLWSEGIVDPGEGKTQKSEIRSLQPGTHYEVLVLAQNSYGQSAKVVREISTYNMVPDSCLQTPDRLGFGVGIGISIMIPVNIVIILLWCLFHRRESKHSKRMSNERNGIPLHQDSATDQRAYADFTVAESTLNDYEQLQAPPGK